MGSTLLLVDTETQPSQERAKGSMACSACRLPPNLSSPPMHPILTNLPPPGYLANLGGISLTEPPSPNTSTFLFRAQRIQHGAHPPRPPSQGKSFPKSPCRAWEGSSDPGSQGAEALSQPEEQALCISPPTVRSHSAFQPAAPHHLQREIQLDLV